jgi:hypothetical protein
LIGEKLAEVTLGEAARAHWEELTGLRSDATQVEKGRVVRQEPIQRVNELFLGSLAEVDLVEDFEYPHSLTPGRMSGRGEPRGKLGDVPVLVRYPHFDDASDTGARRLVQSFLVTPGAAESVEQRRRLWLNGVVWLLGNECDNFSGTSDCSANEDLGVQTVCQVFKISAKITNNGRCDAGGVIVTNTVPDEFEIVAANIRSDPEGASTGFVNQRGNTIVYAPGKVAVNSTVELETWLRARRPGNFTSRFAFRANFREPTECLVPIHVNGSAAGNARLEIRHGRAGVALSLHDQCGSDAQLQTSTDLRSWTDFHPNSPDSSMETIPLPTPPDAPVRFFRLRPNGGAPGASSAAP